MSLLDKLPKRDLRNDENGDGTIPAYFAGMSGIGTATAFATGNPEIGLMALIVTVFFGTRAMYYSAIMDDRRAEAYHRQGKTRE